MLAHYTHENHQVFVEYKDEEPPAFVFELFTDSVLKVRHELLDASFRTTDVHSSATILYGNISMVQIPLLPSIGLEQLRSLRLFFSDAFGSNKGQAQITVDPIFQKCLLAKVATGMKNKEIIEDLLQRNLAK